MGASRDCPVSQESGQVYLLLEGASREEPKVIPGFHVGTSRHSLIGKDPRRTQMGPSWIPGVLLAISPFLGSLSYPAIMVCCGLGFMLGNVSLSSSAPQPEGKQTSGHRS